MYQTSQESHEIPVLTKKYYCFRTTLESQKQQQQQQQKKTVRKNKNTSLVQLVFVHPCFSVPVETSAPRKSSKCGSVIHLMTDQGRLTLDDYDAWWCPLGKYGDD